MDLFSSFQISQFLLKLVVCPTGDPVHLLYHKFTGGAVVVQSLSHVRLFATPWTAACQLPCPSLSLRVCSNSGQLGRWCHPTISSSVVPFSSCLQFFPASGSPSMSRLFTSRGQSIGASASVLPMSIQDWFPLGLTGLISLLSKGPSRVFSNTTVWKHQFFSTQPSLWSNYHIHTWLLEKKKNIVLTR